MDKTNNWFHDLFINEAKPALKRHSGNGGSSNPITEPITITENGVYPVPKGGGGIVEEGKEYQFKANITLDEFNSYCANANPVQTGMYIVSGTMQTGWILVNGLFGPGAIMLAEPGAIGGSSGNAYICGWETFASMGVPVTADGWCYLDSNAMTAAPLSQPPTVVIDFAEAAADLATTAIFFDVETKSLDGWGDITVNVENKGAELNIAYGDTAPEDTSKLWVKTTQPSAVKVASEMIHPEETCILLSATLAGDRNGAGAAAVAGKIYIFGGGDYTKTIQCFDTATETISTLDATLPLAGSSTSAVSNGTKIYLFGLGMNTNITASVYCFDTETDTINKLSAELPSGRIGIGTAKIGAKVYLFGGAYGFNQWTMYAECFCFDLDTETISTLSATMPQAKAFMATAVASNKIYLLGGKVYTSASLNSTDTVFCYDVETDEMKQLKNLSVTGLARPKAETIGETIYLFNHGSGYLGNGAIGIYDTLTETYTPLSFFLHNRQISTSSNNADTSLCAIGNKVYAFGGRCKYISIFEAPQDVILATDNLQILPTLSSNKFNLINTDTAQVEIGVNKVYKGNADGIAEEVEAALHNGTSWATI